MAKVKNARSIARLRRLLLLVLVLLIVGLGGLYWFGRAERQILRRPGAQDAGEIEAGEGVVTLGEGFEYTHYEGDRPAFSIRASRTLEDRKEQVFLEDVGIVVTEENGRRWELTADRATYNRELQESKLEGDVRLEGADGFELEADGLDLGNRGRLLSSVGEVRFRFHEDYRGRGDRMRIHFPQELYLLSGNVLIENMPEAPRPLKITAERAFLERSRQLVRADGGVLIEHGGDNLRADDVQLFLDESLSRLRFFRARNDVKGRLLRPTEPGETEGPRRPVVLEAEGRGLVVVVRNDGETPQDLQLEGSPANPAVLVERHPSGLVRRLEAGYMTAKFAEDGSRNVRIFGGTELVERETPRGEITRRIVGDRGWADTNADGALQKARFIGGIEYGDPTLEARGERVVWDAVSGMGEFFATPEDQPAPDPDARVVVVSDRGRLRAPEVRYDRQEGIVQARGGVDTLMEEAGPLESTPLGSGDGPVRVESREAFFREQPRGFLFRGDVRAWQGDGLILADWVRGDEDGRKLTAGGGVRTVWSGPPDGADAAATEPKAPREPLEVVARAMTYLEAEDLLIYEGQVRSEQQGRTLACQRLEAELLEDGGVEELRCAGDVHLVDRASGNDVKAERVRYDPERGYMEFFGAPDDPVVVEDRDGTSLQAQRIDYEIEGGRVHARRTEPVPSEDPADPVEEPAESSETPTREGEQE